DLDGTEDHYFLVEMVPNFAFKCGSYYYRPGDPNSVSETDDRYIYTHVYTNDKGEQVFIRYHKIPVSMADATIDPVTGEATAHVEFIRQPGMPLSARYPSSDLLSYGALTEDKTCSRWDSNDPNDPNFVNRKGADGEYSYENNTSVIIRNGMDNGAPDADIASPDLPGISIGGGGETPGGSGGGYIHWENGPGMGWSGGYLPIGGEPGEYWKEDGPVGGGVDWWKPEGGIGQSTGSLEDWIPAGGGGWSKLPGGGGVTGGSTPEGGGWENNKWIASHSQGIAIEWVFENSTPWGHTDPGQYHQGVVPTAMYFTNDNPNAAYVLITIPGDSTRLINTNMPHGAGGISHDLDPTFYVHPRAILAGGTPIAPMDPITGNITYRVDAPGGKVPDGSVFLMVSPDSMGEDFQLEVKWYDSSDTLLSSGPVDVMVDAVAQWANFELDKEGGVYGVAGDEPTQLVDVDVNAYFLDQDGSEANYVLVEKIPGVLALHKGASGAYDAVREVYLEGKTYFLIEPTKAEQAANKVHLEFSINEELTSPMYVEDLVFKGHHYEGMKINIGTMTVEGQTGWGATANQPANWEYTLSNNTSLNLQEDALTIVISKVNAKGGNNAIIAEETHDPDNNLIWLNPDDPSHGLNLVKDHNDILTSLIFTSMAGNGSFWYIDGNNVAQPVPLGVNMATAYLAGKIYYRQDRYQDADATLGWTATLQDGLTSTSTATVSGTLTMAVDAVAKADEISLGYPIQDKANHTLTQTLTFADHEANEEHYAVIAPDLYRVIGKQADVLDAATGTWHTVDVVTIFSPSGDPYYAVRVDGYLDTNGSVTVCFGMKELNVPGIENYPVVSGGVSIEPNSGFYPDDREPVLTNNWAINTRVEFPGQGAVSTTGLALTAVAVTEDDASGAPVTLAGTIGANDVLLSAVLTFSAPARAVSDVLGGSAGEQIATIIYNGQCFAVEIDGAGRAVASIDFGAGGFDPAADFRIIWAVAHMQDGVLVVDSWNHNAEDCVLDLTTVFTVQNTVSGQTAAISGTDPDGVQLVARADAAENVSGQTTAINDQPAADADPVGAGADDVTVTLTGTFADVDGSEGHYLM
ncbi:MAG: hypothetical protein K2O70_05430, partial [Desulfovibrionaceae bacterium]|nr:hypothetical protein [Desulfovibrionaceae bacterium]